jgi:hypothetical protein
VHDAADAVYRSAGSSFRRGEHDCLRAEQGTEGPYLQDVFDGAFADVGSVGIEASPVLPAGG